MRRVLVVGFAALLMPVMASAQTEPAPLADFTSLCEEAASTGFNWDNGAWVQVNFKPEKYIVRKVSKVPEEAINQCHGEPDRVEGPYLRRLEGCYSFAVLGEKPSYEWCVEWSAGKDNLWTLWFVECNRALSLKFLPTGPFNFSRWSGVAQFPLNTIVDDDGYQEALKVSHGKCTIIQ